MLGASKWLKGTHGPSCQLIRSVTRSLHINLGGLPRSAHQLPNIHQSVSIRTLTSTGNLRLPRQQHVPADSKLSIKHSRKAFKDAYKKRRRYHHRLTEHVLPMSLRLAPALPALRGSYNISSRPDRSKTLALYGIWALLRVRRAHGDTAQKHRIGSRTWYQSPQRQKRDSPKVHQRSSLDKGKIIAKRPLHQPRYFGQALNHSARGWSGQSYLWWYKMAAQAAARHDGLAPPNSNMTPEHFPFSLYAEKSQETTFVDDASAVDVWNRMGPSRQRRLWKSAILYALYEGPESAASLLSSMMSKTPSLVPLPIAKYTIVTIVNQLLHEKSGTVSGKSRSDLNARARTCATLVEDYIDVYGKSWQEEALFSDRTILKLVQHLNKDQVRDFVSALARSQAFINTKAVCLLSLAYTANGALDSAINLLSRIPKNELSSDHVRRACTKILATTIREKVDYSIRTDILTHMLELGIVPDESMRDVIIWNAVAAGDRDTAWTSHEMAVSKGLQPTAITYIYLLHNPKIVDPQTISRIHRTALHEGLLTRSPQLARRMVDAVGKCFIDHGNASRFRYMTMMYKDLFDSRPLQEIGVFGKSRSPLSRKLLLPDAYTLSIMIWAWILAQTDPIKIEAVYSRWLYHVEKGSPRIVLTGENNFVRHAFLMKLGRLGRVLTCKKIMETHLQTKLIESHPTKSGNERSQRAQARNWTLSRPDSLTWNIFLKCLLQNGYSDAAREVYDIMHSLKHKVTEATYNTMLSHFAKEQDWDNVMDFWALRQKAGFSINKWSRRAIAPADGLDGVLQRLAEAMEDREKAKLPDRRTSNDGRIPRHGKAALDNTSFVTLAQEQETESHWSREEWRQANADWKRRSRLLGTGNSGHISANR